MSNRWFTFPNPVNEVSARLVAAGVLVQGVVIVAFDQPWLIAVLAFGFVARVLAGPRFSPLGQIVTRGLTPRLPFRAKFVAGPPKRFAQGIGATFSVTAAVLHFGFGATGAAYILVGLIMIAATLESVFAVCLGCTVFGLLMSAGFVPESVCERCSNIWADSAVH